MKLCGRDERKSSNVLAPVHDPELSWRVSAHELSLVLIVLFVSLPLSSLSSSVLAFVGALSFACLRVLGFRFLGRGRGRPREPDALPLCFLRRRMRKKPSKSRAPRNNPARPMTGTGSEVLRAER